MTRGAIFSMVAGIVIVLAFSFALVGQSVSSDGAKVVFGVT